MNNGSTVWFTTRNQPNQIQTGSLYEGAVYIGDEVMLWNDILGYFTFDPREHGFDEMTEFED